MDWLWGWGERRRRGASEVPDPWAAGQRWPHLSDGQGWFQCSVGRRAWLEFRREWNVEMSKRWVETPLSRVRMCARVCLCVDHKNEAAAEGHVEKAKVSFCFGDITVCLLQYVMMDRRKGKHLRDASSNGMRRPTGLIPSSPVSRQEHAPVCPYSQRTLLLSDISSGSPHTHTRNSLSFLCRVWYLGCWP